MGYIYNAYSIAKTGKNVFGEPFPFLTWMVKDGFPFMPVPMYLTAPLFFILPLIPFVGRLPSAVFGVIDVLLLFVLVKELFRDRTLALLSAAILAISPWHLHFSRSAYDANFSLFFYLSGIVMFIWNINRKKSPLIALPFFFLAFFSYRGMSILAIPILLVLLLWSMYAKRMSTKHRGIVILGIGIMCATTIATITLVGRPFSVEGLSQFIDPKIQEEVDSSIRESYGPLVLRRIFLNKPTYIAARLRENYMRLYSPEFLFLTTEPHQIYSIWTRGRLYFFDLPFIILGIIFLLRTKRKETALIVSLMLIGGLPALAGQPYSSRAYLLSSLYPILAAGGIVRIASLSKRYSFGKVMILFIVLGYVFSLGSYLFDYYGRYAHQGAEAWAKSLKDVSRIIQESKDHKDTVLITGTFGDFVQYAFYKRLNPTNVQRAWEERHFGPVESYRHENVLFASVCLEQMYETASQRGETVLFITRESCYESATPSSTIRDYYRNVVWRLYENSI
jgi:hypothetical protein